MNQMMQLHQYTFYCLNNLFVTKFQCVLYKLENIAHLGLGFATVFLAHEAGQKHEQMRKKQNKHEPSSLSLSFQDICPQWNNALSTRFSNNSRLNISDAKYCIVGEAHGFRNSTYICSKCWEYSQSFTHCVYGSGDYNNYSITDHMLFEHLKENFIEHFNQSHVRKKGLRRAVKVWIGKAHKVECALSHTSSSTDDSNNSIAARAINTKSQVTTTPATPPQHSL